MMIQGPKFNGFVVQGASGAVYGLFLTANEAADWLETAFSVLGGGPYHIAPVISPPLTGAMGIPLANPTSKLK